MRTSCSRCIEVGLTLTLPRITPFRSLVPLIPLASLSSLLGARQLTRLSIVGCSAVQCKSVPFASSWTGLIVPVLCLLFFRHWILSWSCPAKNATNNVTTQHQKHLQGIPFILVGTKLDLRDDQDACKRLAERRQTPISFSEAQGLATDLEAYRYLECSALTQHGLKQVGGWVGTRAWRLRQRCGAAEGEMACRAWT